MSTDLVHCTTCRICLGSDLDLVLALGPTPLANAFLDSPESFADERSYPLDLYFCRGCSLLQLLDVVDPAVLFRHYLYVTGTSATQVSHNRSHVDGLVSALGLGRDDLVVEVASNDGSFLQGLIAHGVRVLGIEPARNLAAEAIAAGVPTIDEFFTSAVAARVRAAHGPARVVVAKNVLAHVDDPRDFLAGCRDLLAPDGVVVVEVPYVGDLLDRVEYDTVYHEHLSYFSVSALMRLGDVVGLCAAGVEHVPVHGGSLRVTFARATDGHGEQARQWEARERLAGLADEARYRRFAADVHESRRALVALLDRLAADGHVVAAYGAPAKGNTLFNFCGLDTSRVRYTVDRNPRKIGLFTPGAHIPVRDVSSLYRDSPYPDFVLILAWNLADEIMRQQQAHRERGGRFILPVPRAEVV